MGEPLRVTLAVLVLVGGWGALGYALYLQYVSLPSEHTLRHVSMRAALALVGLTLLFLGSLLLS